MKHKIAVLGSGRPQLSVTALAILSSETIAIKSTETLADKRPKAKPAEQGKEEEHVHGGGSGGIKKTIKADDRKPRIIHIDGGCSDLHSSSLPMLRQNDEKYGEGILAIPTSRGPAQFGQVSLAGITKMGPQQRSAASVGA
jgi:hypothetical protein